MDISKINDIYEYADALGVAYYDLSLDQIAEWVKAGHTRNIPLPELRYTIGFAKLKDFPIKKAQSYMLQAILSDKVYTIHRLHTEVIRKDSPVHTPDELYTFLLI